MPPGHEAERPALPCLYAQRFTQFNGAGLYDQHGLGLISISLLTNFSLSSSSWTLSDYCRPSLLKTRLPLLPLLLTLFPRLLRLRTLFFSAVAPAPSTRPAPRWVLREWEMNERLHVRALPGCCNRWCPRRSKN